MGREWNWSRSLTRGEKENSAGCMGGMLHYLDFHHLLFTSGHGGTSTSNSGSGISRANRAQQLLSSSPRVCHASNSQLKGLEAPRNSLELDDGKARMSTMTMEDEFFDVPIAIQVATVASSSASSKRNMMMVLEEEKRSSSSQAETPRTPSVVARLMGLEVLPDQASSPGACSPRTPSLVGKNKQSKVGNVHRRDQQLPQRQPLRSLNCNLPALPQLRAIDVSSSRSLPETPRGSVSSTRSWDPRLSLQINKENTCNAAQAEFGYLYEAPIDYSLPTSPSAFAAAKLRRKHRYGTHQDENKSPRSHYYAREIVRQLKETISSRRSGGNGGNAGAHVDETGTKLAKRSRPAEKKADCDPETQNQAMSSVIKPQLSPPSTPPVRLPEAEKAKCGEDRALKPPLPTNYKEGGEGMKPPPKVPNRCRKAAFDRFTEKIKKQPPAKDNNRRSSLSQPLPTLALTGRQITLNHKKKSIPNASTVTSGRKEASASPSRPSTNPSREFVTGVEGSSSNSSSVQRTRQPTEQDPEYRYLKSILEHARVKGSSVAPCLRWHSPALPVDPVLFHQLELELELRDDDKDECVRRLGPLRHRWNRKLLFHVVEEILADLMVEWSTGPSSATLADHIVSRESRRSLHHLFSHGVNSCRRSNGEPLLLRQLWARIRSFPEADCRVVGDIDALASGDLSSANTRRLLRHPSVVEEAEDVVAEVEQELLDSLIGEAAASLVVAAPRGPSCLRRR